MDPPPCWLGQVLASLICVCPIASPYYGTRQHGSAQAHGKEPQSGKGYEKQWTQSKGLLVLAPHNQASETPAWCPQVGQANCRWAASWAGPLVKKRGQLQSNTTLPMCKCASKNDSLVVPMYKLPTEKMVAKGHCSNGQGKFSNGMFSASRSVAMWSSVFAHPCMYIFVHLCMYSLIVVLSRAASCFRTRWHDSLMRTWTRFNLGSSWEIYLLLYQIACELYSSLHNTVEICAVSLHINICILH